MATERTLSIIKPDATKRNLTGKIVAKFEDAGLRVVACKRIHLTPAQAGEFMPSTRSAAFMVSFARSWLPSRLWFRFWRAKAPLPRTAK